LAIVDYNVPLVKGTKTNNPGQQNFSEFLTLSVDIFKAKYAMITSSMQSALAFCVKSSSRFSFSDLSRSSLSYKQQQ